MKQRLSIFFIVLVCSLCTPLFAAINQNEQPLDQIAATVNQNVITESELQDAITNIKNQLHRSNMAVPSEDALRRQVLDQLINRKLQLDVAEQNGVKISDEELDKGIALIASNNHITVNDLYSKLASDGVTRAEYRKEIKEEMIIQKVQQQAIGNSITVSPQEVDDFMRSAVWQSSNRSEYHLLDILIAVPDSPTAQQVLDAKKRAELLVQKLHAGLPFEQAAIAESGDNKALEGGDLGWRKLPEIPAAFAEPLAQMKTGDIMGPLQTPNGFHIVKIAGIRSTTSAPASHQQIEHLLFQRKYNESVQNWTMKLRSSAVVIINSDNS